jgi:hypothetical protein
MIKPEDRKLLRVGDVIYSWRTYGVGNTTLRARSIYETKITRIDDDGTIWGSWNGNPPTRLLSWQSYSLHHPKPHRSAYAFSHEDSYDSAVSDAAEVAVASRAEWRNRRKSAKKEPTNA